MNAMHDAKLKALKDRRGKGIDIQILLNGEQFEPNKEESDEMAPDAPVVGEKMEEEMPMEAEMSPEQMDQDMASEMPMEEMPDIKPRSLGERAKMALMKRVKK